LIHPAIDAAKSILNMHPDAKNAAHITADVGELAKQVTGGKNGAPATPLAGKFDLKYCIALALHGHTLAACDFREPMRLDPAVADTARRITVNAPGDYGFASARLSVDPGQGSGCSAEVKVAKGHPGNPIGWSEMHDKFSGLVDFAPNDAAKQLFAELRSLGERPDVAIARNAARLLS
jgi:2-methylcitrate dehydratase PrpD